MTDFFYNPTYWHWLILGFICFGLELFAPGAFFLWLGFAAIASAALSLLMPDLNWAIQYFIFGVFSVASLVMWKQLSKKSEAEETDQPYLNQRSKAFLGRVVVLSEPIVNGYGKVIINDSHWKVTGPDAAVGSKVRVTTVDGSLLHVVPE